MQIRLTKTFAENRFFARESPGVFTEIPREQTQEGPPLDAQIKEWVESTGNIIIHPGQLGMHTAWHGTTEDPYQLKCVTLGLTVLYVEPQNAQGQSAATTEQSGHYGPIPHADNTGSGVDPGNAPASPGTVQAGVWSDPGSAADGRRAETQEGGRRETQVVGAESEDAPATTDGENTDSPATETQASGAVAE